tara:strand:- start:3719 stop:3877 length:159 start_codon:yes stop_codon:yes gene_type:complete
LGRVDRAIVKNTPRIKSGMHGEKILLMISNILLLKVPIAEKHRCKNVSENKK